MKQLTQDEQSVLKNIKSTSAGQLLVKVLNTFLTSDKEILVQSVDTDMMKRFQGKALRTTEILKLLD